MLQFFRSPNIAEDYQKTCNAISMIDKIYGEDAP